MDTPSTEGYLYREPSGTITTVAGPEPGPGPEQHFELDTVYIPDGKVGIQYYSMDKNSMPVRIVETTLLAGHYTVNDIVEWINSYLLDGTKGLRAELLDSGYVRLWHWGINGGKTMITLAEDGTPTPMYHLCVLLGLDPAMTGPIIDIVWQEPFVLPFKQQLNRLKPKSSIAWIPYSVEFKNNDGSLEAEPVVRRALFIHDNETLNHPIDFVIGRIEPPPRYVISITGSYMRTGSQTTVTISDRWLGGYAFIAEVNMSTGDVRVSSNVTSGQTIDRICVVVEYIA